MFEEFFDREEIKSNLLVANDRFTLLDTLRIVMNEVKTDFTFSQFVVILNAIGFVNEDLIPSENLIKSGYAELNKRPIEKDGKIIFCILTEFTEKGVRALIHIFVELNLNGSLKGLLKNN